MFFQRHVFWVNSIHSYRGPELILISGEKLLVFLFKYLTAHLERKNVFRIRHSIQLQTFKQPHSCLQTSSQPWLYLMQWSLRQVLTGSHWLSPVRLDTRPQRKLGWGDRLLEGHIFIVCIFQGIFICAFLKTLKVLCSFHSRCDVSCDGFEITSNTKRFCVPVECAGKM